MCDLSKCLSLALTYHQGTFLEFLGVLDVLKKKYTAENLPFHVIVPSLPGYGYSSGPSLSKDWTVEDMARVINKLMLGLNLKGYVAQGGDIGSFCGRVLAAEYDACKALHRMVGVVLLLQQTNKILQSISASCPNLQKART